MAEAWTTVEDDQGSDGRGEVTKYTVPGVEWFFGGGPVEGRKTVIGAFDRGSHCENIFDIAGI